MTSPILSLPLALQDAGHPFFSLTEMDVVGAWLICFLTLSVFSFLYKDNPFYKIAEHTFVGAGTAFFTLQYYNEGILEPLRDHIERAHVNMGAGTDIQIGGIGVDPVLAIVLRCLAIVLAMMLASRLFSPKARPIFIGVMALGIVWYLLGWQFDLYAPPFLVFMVIGLGFAGVISSPSQWAARWPLAIMVGIYAALKMTGETQSKLVLVVKGAMKPLTDPTKLDWSDNWTKIEETQLFYTFANGVLLVGFICALAHFLFTYKRTRVLSGMSRVGIITLMITFGSMFGFTVLGRYALLIERVDQLEDFSGADYSLAGSDGSGLVLWTSPPVLVAILIALVLVVWKLRSPTDDEPAQQA